MTNAKGYITAERGDIYWRYEVPPDRGAKVQLLTVGGVAVYGQWYGKLGENFLAWAPLPKRDKAQEALLFRN